MRTLHCILLLELEWGGVVVVQSANSQCAPMLDTLVSPLKAVVTGQPTVLFCTLLKHITHGFLSLTNTLPLPLSTPLAPWRATRYNTVDSTGLLYTHGFSQSNPFKSIPTVQCNTKWRATCYNTVHSTGMVDSHMGFSPFYQYFTQIRLLYPLLYCATCYTFHTVLHSTGMVDTHGFLPLTYGHPLAPPAICHCN